MYTDMHTQIYKETGSMHYSLSLSLSLSVCPSIWHFGIHILANEIVCYLYT